MKTRHFLSLFASYLLAVGPTDAQTAPASTLQEDPLLLSPFIVNNQRDTGYQATSTLAGTRLNTPLADLGASISVYTKEFLTDIGATSANDVLIFATNMEAAGPGGNVSGVAGGITDTEFNSDGPRVNPLGGARARGLSNPGYTRNYFTTDIPLDGFNTEAITLSRGPNAILFGVGSPAGIVETSLIQANTRRNTNKVEVRYGNNDALRTSVDFNRVLVPGKLAVRLAALRDNERFNQRPAFDHNRRLYGTAKYEPFKTTAIRASLETGRNRANRPITALPYNSISPAWYAAGRQTFDWAFYDDPARNPNAATQNSFDFRGLLIGNAQLFGQIAAMYSSPTANAFDIVFRNNLGSTNGTVANVIRNPVMNPVVNRDGAADSLEFYGTFNIGELVPGYWTGSTVLPGQQPGYRPSNIKQQGFLDYSAFDFADRLIDESSRQSAGYHTYNVTFEQRGWGDRFGVELGYDRQRYDRRSKNSFFGSNQSNHIRIDSNVTLPTGRLNPNLGRPYAQFGQSSWTNYFSDRETLRATGFLRYDFKEANKSWSRWLGRHTLTGLAEENTVTTINYGTRLADDGPSALDLNPSIAVFGRRPALIVYMGPSIIGNNNPLRLEPIRIPQLVAGQTINVPYFTRAANNTDPGAFVSTPFSLVGINDGGSAQRELIRSRAFSLQSYWLQDYLITLVGWRRDDDYFVRRSIVTGSPYFNAVNPNPNDPGKVEYGFADLPFPNTPPFNVAKEVKTYSAVLKWPARYLPVPVLSNLSVFYNRSENFTPAGGRVDPYNSSLPSPQGTTREYGISWSSRDARFSVRANRFETKVQGQGVGSPAGNAFLNGTTQLASFWATEGNRNPENVGFMNAAIEKIFSTLPANYRGLNGFTIAGSAPNISATYNGLTGITDTTDVLAKGTEIEVVFNPTRNWRILANVARQETILTNSYPVTKEFVARMLPAWTGDVTYQGVTVNMRDIPRAGYGVGFGPTNPPSPATERFGGWLDTNILVPFATGLATEGVASAEQRKWRANLVTNYTFGRDSIFDGRLDGWKVGAGARWQDKLGLGYPSTRNPNGSVSIDLQHPYYAPAEINVDTWIGYTRKIWKDRIEWQVQLNVRNAIADRDPIAFSVQPTGEIAAVRNPPERRWYLTNTFSF